MIWPGRADFLHTHTLCIPASKLNALARDANPPLSSNAHAQPFAKQFLSTNAALNRAATAVGSGCKHPAAVLGAFGAHWAALTRITKNSHLLLLLSRQLGKSEKLPARKLQAPLAVHGGSWSNGTLRKGIATAKLIDGRLAVHFTWSQPHSMKVQALNAVPVQTCPNRLRPTHDRREVRTVDGLGVPLRARQLLWQLRHDELPRPSWHI